MRFENICEKSSLFQGHREKCIFNKYTEQMLREDKSTTNNQDIATVHTKFNITANEHKEQQQ